MLSLCFAPNSMRDRDLELGLAQLQIGVRLQMPLPTAPASVFDGTWAPFYSRFFCYFWRANDVPRFSQNGDPIQAIEQ